MRSLGKRCYWVHTGGKDKGAGLRLMNGLCGLTRPEVIVQFFIDIYNIWGLIQVMFDVQVVLFTPLEQSLFTYFQGRPVVENIALVHPL